eukprot:374301-Rhodomonas_salina.1
MTDPDVENFASWTRRLSEGQADANLGEDERGLRCNGIPDITTQALPAPADPLQLETRVVYREALENALADPEGVKIEVSHRNLVSTAPPRTGM